MNDFVLNALKLLGGLAMFLFGMTVMGNALEKRAGSQLKNILANLTSSPLKGFLLGMGVTAVIQSSSATTVMVVGFVNSGIMQLHHAIGVIMGANVGTSVTSWLLSLTGIEGDVLWVQLLKPTSFTPVLAFIGVILYMFCKRQKTKDTGLILLGFAVLMFGMDSMSAAVKPLAGNESFQQILILFSNPLFGVLAGTILTAIIQSSSASVGILQALSMTGSITCAAAVPIIMGQNIGTCISTILSSIGANKNAKRASTIHVAFNIIATLILLPLYCLADYLIERFVGFSVGSIVVDPLIIAIIHTVFNLLAVVILMPFSKQLEKLACFLVRDGKKEEHTQLLDKRLLATPSVAVERCREVAGVMAEISVNSLLKSLDLITNFSQKGADEVRDDENRVDHYEDELGTYLVKLSSLRMSEADSAEASKLLHIIGDFERISDHAVNIVESAEEIRDKKLVLSADAQRELAVMLDAIREILDLALQAFSGRDYNKVFMIEPLEEVIDHLRDSLKRRHITRLQRNDCTIEMGFVLSDLLINLERVADHCSNVGCCMIEMTHESLDVHEYLTKLKAQPNSEFTTGYEYYRTKYSLA
ncbi:MAG: Na/Pi cotransporter family protein [Ruminococcaceae bacterium]|nr:Na/Pi cotransporter family protein [Oscillospiraceae bacterium]